MGRSSMYLEHQQSGSTCFCFKIIFYLIIEKRKEGRKSAKQSHGGKIRSLLGFLTQFIVIRLNCIWQDSIRFLMLRGRFLMVLI